MKQIKRSSSVYVAIALFTFGCFLICSWATNSTHTERSIQITNNPVASNNNFLNPKSNRQGKTSRKLRISKFQYMAMDMTHSSIKNESPVPENIPTNEDEIVANQRQWAKISEVFFSYEGQQVMESMFAEETYDPNWTDHIRRYAESVLNTEQYPDSTLEKVDCRQQFCKVVIYHLSEDDMNRFKSEAASAGPWEGEQYGNTEDLPYGAKRTLFYFLRAEAGSSPFMELRNRLEQKLDAGVIQAEHDRPDNGSLQAAVELTRDMS